MRLERVDTVKWSKPTWPDEQVRADVAKLAGRCPLYVRVHRRRWEKVREPLGVTAPTARLTSLRWTDAGLTGLLMRA